MTSPRDAARTNLHGPVAITASALVLLSVLALAVSDEPPRAPGLTANSPETPATIAEVVETTDVRELVVGMFGAHPSSPETFEGGSVSSRTEDLPEVTQTETGFVISLPSGTPVPTPTIHDGRMYFGGGFSSMEFHCFDARTGRHVWSVDVSDDGPSWAVVSDGVVTFNTESCTLFALDAATGEQLWSWYLSDPLLSSPTVAAGRVYTVYVAEAPLPDDAGDNLDSVPLPTHMLICFDLRTGAPLWQRPLDSECISAPVATEETIYVTSFTGRLYQFRQSDGELLSARDMRATTAPVVAGSALYIGRRADGDDSAAITESIVRCRVDGLPMDAMALAWPAPYLDGEIQERASYTDAAGGFESSNGIYGGFGGGFGAPSGGGFHQIAPPSSALDSAPEVPVEEPVEPESTPVEFEATLSIIQRQAIRQIGLGNVSTLQAYQGSRPLLWSDRNFCCIGDRVACLAADSGRLLWELPLDGNLEELGGHLGSPPVAAGDSLYVATVGGDVLRIDPVNGEIRETCSLDAPIRFAPSVFEGRLYVGTQDGKVICVRVGDDNATGWPTWGGDPGHSNVCRADAPWTN